MKARCALSCILLLTAGSLLAQIDPEKRQLLQLGYNQPVEGRAPLAGYAFFYLNQPAFLRTNLTLRLAVAPVYVDSDFAVAGPKRTDWSIGLGGGGFADSYYEIRRGKFIERESFNGHGGEFSAGLYHRFNPDQQMPLNAIVRLTGHFSTYERTSKTAHDFRLPPDRTTMSLRTGLRYGGTEPLAFPQLGAELSAWYEGQYRTHAGEYGFGDREVEEFSHLFWARALLVYTIPDWNHTIAMNLTMGTSVEADRFDGFRLGGVLPLASEFPLSLPGYYYQEIRARRFALLNGQYTFPLDQHNRWTITTVGAIGTVSYLRGFPQKHHLHSGISIGLGYRSPKEAYHVAIGYSYAFEAIRADHRGAQSVGLLFQWDLEARRLHRTYFDYEIPQKSRGLFQLFGR